MKFLANNLRFVTLGILILLALVSQIHCGSGNNSSSTAATGTVTATGVVGPSGNTYSVTLTPSTSTPSVGSTITASITVTDSAAENLTINAGYYNSSGSQVPQCSQSNGGSTSITISCVMGPFSTSENQALYVDVFETGGAEELACDVTGTPGCSGTFEITVGTGGSGGTYYICPNSPSTSCGDASECQSTCMGQYSNLSTCTTYGQGGIAGNAGTQLSCQAVTGAYSCPVVKDTSTNCMSASSYESTCGGQLQATATCTYYNASCAATLKSCTNESGTTANIYYCEYIPSNGCGNTSLCESTCMGQYQTSPTCTYYGPNAVPTEYPCTPAGSVSF